MQHNNTNVETICINTRDVSDALEHNNAPNAPKPIYGLIGLVNLQNTCYMNSAIQAFSHNYLLTNYFFNNEEEIKLILLKNAKKILQNNDAFQLENNDQLVADIVSSSLINKIHDDYYHPKMLTPEEEIIVLNYTMTFQLLKLLKIMWGITNKHHIVPTSFHTLFSEARDRFFYGHQQHDAEEAYSCILQKVQEELSEEKKINFIPRKESVNEFMNFKNHIVNSLKNCTLEEKRLLIEKYNQKKIDMPEESLTIDAYREMRNYYGTCYSRVTEIFSGFLHSSTNCPDNQCNYSSNKFDPFLHLALSMPNKYAFGSFFNYDNTNSQLTIEQCLKEYCRDEILDENNLWKCSRCNNYVKAVKKLQIWRAPPVLVIALKRFSENRMHKDTRMITYPLEHFDISTVISQAQLHPSKCTKYRLQCVINHTGNMLGGHYYTYCLDEDTGKWHEFNDQHVHEISENKIVTNNAYILFYVREDLVNH